MGEKKNFWFYRYCSTYTLRFFTTGPLTSDVPIDSLIYFRPTFTWPPRYHHITSNFLRDSFQKDFCSIGTIFLKWAVICLSREIAGDVVIARRSRDGRAEVCRWIYSTYKDITCKEHAMVSPKYTWWIFLTCRQNNIYKTKNASFSLYIYNLNPDFKYYDIFTQVIIFSSNVYKDISPVIFCKFYCFYYM